MPGKPRPVGLTQDVGWEIGVSRTFPVTVEEAWAVLIGREGLALWLGEVDSGLPGTPGSPYRTATGATGELRSFHPGDRVRLTYQPAGRSGPTTLQVTVRGRETGKGPSTIVRFHQEHLADEAERHAQRLHWTQVLDTLDPLLGEEPDEG